MGKRLTDEQKAANKEALKIKRRAFEQRKRELEAAAEKLNAEHGLPALVAASEAASAERDAIWRRGTDRMDELRRLFDAQMAALKVEHDAACDAARRATDAAYQSRRQAEQAVDSALRAKFPDMFDRYGHAYLSTWSPPSGYIDAGRRKGVEE